MGHIKSECLGLAEQKDVPKVGMEGGRREGGEEGRRKVGVETNEWCRSEMVLLGACLTILGNGSVRLGV